VASFDAFPRSLKQALTGDVGSGIEKSLRVPPWQRSYAWRPTEVDQFWNDLVSFSDDCPRSGPFGSPQYFIGSIVLVTSEELDQHILLDGQQRLVTSTLLLAAIRDYIREEADPTDEASRQRAADLQKEFIVSQDVFAMNSVPRITLNVFDEPYFRDFVQSPAGETANFAVRPEYESHRRIRRAYQLLIKNLREHVSEKEPAEGGIAWAFWLAAIMTMNVVVIVATSDDEDTAAEIFETLNDRGIGLSTPDLLRNLLLRRSGARYRTEIIDRWREILRIEEVARTDLFLRHFWISRKGDVKQHSLYRAMRNEIYRKTAQRYPLDFTKELAESAKTYEDLVTAHDDDDETAKFLRDVNLLDAFSLRPALLSAWEHGDSGDRRGLTRSLIAFFVRHRVIVGLENNEFERIVFSLAEELRESGDFAAALDSLRAAPPSDDDFESAFAKAIIPRANTARYLLTEFERRRWQNQEIAVEGADHVHVEHIYPQSPPATWRAENHDQIIDRAGNLTLLGRPLNQALANAKFSTKRDNEARGYRTSELKITLELTQPPYDTLEYWTSNEIDERQARLAEEARVIWKI
jgi:Protein of unknown function DUF262/Protein of unknown function (DUF1524)